MHETKSFRVQESPIQPIPAKSPVTSNRSEQQPRHEDSSIARFAQGGLTFVVIGLLGGIAYWGHDAGWKIPKFNELFGSQAAEKDDWCQEHSVPESICVECNESLLPRLKSVWCRKHGVHYCPFEHPEVAQLSSVPTISGEDFARAQRALDLKDRPENSAKCELHNRRIQFASEDVMNKMGIDIAPAWRGPIVETVNASGEIVFAQPRVGAVSVSVAGRVWDITEKGVIGTTVKPGDVLAIVDAVEVGKAKAELLQAYAQTELRKKRVDKLEALAAQGAISSTALLEAESALREGRIRLMAAQQSLINMGLPLRFEEEKAVTTEELSRRIHFFGIPTEITSRLDARTTTANLLPVFATRPGIVTAAKVARGEMVEPGKAIFVVADNSRMWLMLNVRLEDVKYLRVKDAKTDAPGQIVRFRPDGSDRSVDGQLIWKSTEVDEKTRTVQYYAELLNPNGVLLANSYGKAQIIVREEDNAILVPSEAVHWEGDCHIVFVRDKHFFDKDGKKVFHVRSVRPGVTSGMDTEIIAGLLPGEVVATRNSANMRAELLKGNLGEP